VCSVTGPTVESNALAPPRSAATDAVITWGPRFTKYLTIYLKLIVSFFS